ncbi:MAG: AMP-binding protein, partial [Lacisediminimonas sp.]|nr:AMP-binding protein [Lacisediminimonas sp.]
MNFFDILRSHALRLPDSIATASSRHRRTTYRQLWSRIERGSARLQGEWLVEPGDIVIYAGHAHPDALVLWLSLARLGAALLPLESAALLLHAGALASRHEVRLLLHDDDLPAPLPDEFCACARLSALIARRCEHEA